MLCAKRNPNSLARLRQTYETSIKANAPGVTLDDWLAMAPVQRHRLYQRVYYRTNREKAKEYQREYNRAHSKMRRVPRTKDMRERTRTHIHRYNIATLSTPHFEKFLTDILSGVRKIW